jgi:colicin import membrane protein
MATKVQGTKNRRVAEMRDNEVLESVKGLNLDKVSKDITSAQVEVQKTLAGVSAQLMDQLQILENVEISIRLKREELKQLHDIEATASTLDQLEEQIAKQRREWDEERAAKAREFAEMRSERNKTWAREEEEYQYKIAQEHKKLADSFQALQAQQERQNRDKQEQLEKTWAEREGELKKREQELADLRKFKDDYSEMVKKEVNASVAVATNSLKKEYETKMVLAAKDADTEKRLSEQTIASLNQNLGKMQSQLEDLNAKLEQAQRDVKEISAKALESASGRATTEALQRIMEKEQGSGKQTK